MSWFFHHKQNVRDNLQDDNISSIEITQIKRKGHRTIDKADKEITKVNNLLKANGITLKIHIASGGHHGR